MRFTKNVIVIETSKGSMTIPCKIGNNISSTYKSLTCLACPSCNGDIGMTYYCKSCNKGKDGSELSRSDTKTAIRIDKTNKTVLTDEIKGQINNIDKVIEVLGSIKKENIDPKRIIGSFVLIPDEKQPAIIQKFYSRLMLGLSDSDNNLVVRFSNSAKQQLGILTVDNNLLTVLNVAYLQDYNNYKQDINTDLTTKEIESSKNFVNKIKPINIDSITDIRRDKIEQIITKGVAVQVEEPVKEPEIDPFDSEPIAIEVKEPQKKD